MKYVLTRSHPWKLRRRFRRLWRPPSWPLRSCQLLLCVCVKYIHMPFCGFTSFKCSTTYTTASLVASKVAPTLVAACLPYASLASKALLLSSPIVVPVELQGEFLTSILINAKNQRQKPYTMASFEAFAAASLALKSLPGNAAILSALALECHEQKQNYMSHY